MSKQRLGVPHFAAASALLISAAFGAAVAFAQETPPSAPVVPPAPAAPVPSPPPAEPADKAKIEAEKKQFGEVATAYQNVQKAYSDLDRKRVDEMVNALKLNNMAVRGYAYPTTDFLHSARLPSKMISVDLKNVPARDAVAKILDDAKLNYVINDDFPQDVKLSLSISGVQVSTALDLITESAGVRWAAEKRDNKIMVRVGKNIAANNVFGFTYTSPNALSNLSRAAKPVTTLPSFRRNGVSLPPAKISLNVKDASPREALVTLLEKQKLAYDIADDFPKNSKITLVVEDADISSVLDSITRSVGFQWVAEKQGDKIVVRVGKKVNSNTLFYQYGEGGVFAPTPPPATPMIYQYRTTEQRSTFTCPRCGKKTTVVQKSTSGGADAKPGAKTTSHEDWHYCPYCGKKVTDQSANLTTPVWDDDDATAGTGVDEIVLPSLPDLPVFDTSFTDNPMLFERD